MGKRWDEDNTGSSAKNPGPDNDNAATDEIELDIIITDDDKVKVAKRCSMP